ncbi:MAG: DUF3810 domain-containing protein [Vicinamibacteria bacterium]|nr:DUF3810 domain-containing protein [Vicinamibacteria bacterium]
MTVLGRLLAEAPAVVEWHRRAFYPWFAFIAQRISGAWVRTEGEVGALVLIGTAGAALLRWRWRALSGIGFALGLLVFGFYLSWGLAYRYPGLGPRLAPWDSVSEGAPMSERLVELTERSARLLALASEGSVSFEGSEAILMARINSGLRAGVARLPVAIDATPVRTVAFGPAKLSRVSFALSRLQLSGYYLPWTGEAQINAQMPRTLWPRVAAHEGAHQRGFARENEAMVIGLLTCLESPDPMVFYSGTLGLFAGFDRELARVDGEERKTVWAALPRRVREDFTRESAFWKSHEGVAGAISEGANDAYLKAQGVRSGIGSYNETTRLLLQATLTPGLRLAFLLESAEPLPAPREEDPNGAKR